MSNDTTAKTKCATCACGDLKHVHIPPRGPIDELVARGARRTCMPADFHSIQVAVPRDWAILPTGVSDLHDHLCDGEGNVIACILRKTGSGGAGSFQISSKENCAELANS